MRDVRARAPAARTPSARRHWRRRRGPAPSRRRWPGCGPLCATRCDRSGWPGPSFWTLTFNQALGLIVPLPHKTQRQLGRGPSMGRRGAPTCPVRLGVAVGQLPPVPTARCPAHVSSQYDSTIDMGCHATADTLGEMLRRTGRPEPSRVHGRRKLTMWPWPAGLTPLADRPLHVRSHGTCKPVANE